jgi:8-oxo-dGTP pyrophosphatase MutT (NUDIX family)
MIREISAGGVVVRRAADTWQIAVIEPRKEPSGSGSSDKKPRSKVTLALPKGLVDSGEKPDQTALREVREETGVTATLVSKLTDIKYVYVRTWADNEKVFKIVTFYLLRYDSGDIDDIRPEMRIEVKRALWMPLDDVVRKLAYRGEREAAKLAQQYLNSHPEV